MIEDWEDTVFPANECEVPRKNTPAQLKEKQDYLHSGYYNYPIFDLVKAEEAQVGYESSDNVYLKKIRQERKDQICYHRIDVMRLQGYVGHHLIDGTYRHCDKVCWGFPNIHFYGHLWIREGVGPI